EIEQPVEILVAAVLQHGIESIECRDIVPVGQFSPDVRDALQLAAFRMPDEHDFRYIVRTFYPVQFQVFCGIFVLVVVVTFEHEKPEQTVPVIALYRTDRVATGRDIPENLASYEPFIRADTYVC